MRILVTGAAGFFGSHLVRAALARKWAVTGTLTQRHRGNVARLADVVGDPNLRLFYTNLRGPIPYQLVGEVDYIINAAAQSHVDRSISDPVTFIENNVSIMLNVMEYARLKPPKVIQISTDEVYGPSERPVKPWGPIRPSNPYSASKAAQEAIAFAYSRTYGIPLTIINLMNLIGERQDPEKFLPRILRCAMRGESIGIHIDPKWRVPGSRQYMDVLWAAEEVLGHLDSQNKRVHLLGERLDNRQMVLEVQRVLGTPIAMHEEEFHWLRPGHDLSYCLGGGVQFTGVRQTIERVVRWAMENKEWLEVR